MTIRSECAEVVLRELEEYGLKGHLQHRGNSHVDVSWTYPDGRTLTAELQLPSQRVGATLCHLKTKGLVEHGQRGFWRKKAELSLVETA